MALQVYDQAAHELLWKWLDDAESKVVRTNTATNVEATDYLTLEYIKECGCFLSYGAAFFENESKMASEIFIERMLGRSVRLREYRMIPRCAALLSLHTERFFPRYIEFLIVAYTTVLRDTEDLGRLLQNGVVVLAAATVPGAQIQLRREFRRRGLDYDRHLVSDETLAKRLRAAQPLALR
jgi:hypothetical protein